MPVINPNWYNLNSVRNYPIDDGASGSDDAGRLIPPALLVDCRLRWPVPAGRYAFLGALTVTPHLVTVLFLASPAPAQPIAAEAGGGAAAVPIAAVTLPKPVDVGRHYPIESLYPGTGGWIVWGPGIETPYTGRFSSVRQSQLLPRCARAYTPPPIPSLGKEFVISPLTGLIKILGGADIEVIKAPRMIQHRLVDCLVIRLTDDLNRNVLQVYAGPCAGRPETRTCAQPGLEQLNTVGPDCAGNLTIDFRHLQATPLQRGGIILNLGVGLADACPPPYLPDRYGQLPGEFLDTCSVQSLSLPSEVLSSISLPPVPPSSGISETCLGLPFGDGFDAPDLMPGWQLEIGNWRFDSDDSPEEQFGQNVTLAAAHAWQQPLPPGLVTHTTDGAVAAAVPTAPEGPVGWVTPLPPLQYAQPRGYVVTPIDRSVALIDTSKRNVLIWNDCGYDYSLGLSCITHLKMKPGVHRNGGLVLNYHWTGPGGRPQYHLLMANAATNAFELWFYNGTNLSQMTGITIPPPYQILPDLWYEVTAQTRLGSTGKVVIDGMLRAVEQTDMPEASLSLAVTNYLPAQGKFGIGTDQAYTLFSFFGLKETGT